MAEGTNLGLDFVAGSGLAKLELYGDWYRDPWGWPELTGPDFHTIEPGDLGIRKASGEYHLQVRPFFHLIEVPKSWLGVRPAVVQDPLTRLAYLSAVNAGISKFGAELPDWVFGWRAREDGSFAANGGEWANYVANLPDSEGPGFGLQTDLTSFFASVRPSRLAPVVFERLGRVAAAHVIMDVVRAHDALSTRSGLPQRSFGSAILANAVVQPIDDALASALNDGEIGPVRRWMDDISAEGPEDALYSLLLKLQESARQVGLEINSSKTRIVPVADAATHLRLEDLREIEVPVIRNEYSGDEDEEFDMDDLIRLEDRVLKDPRRVPQVIIRAILKSLTKYQVFDRRAEWQANVGYIPHGADSFGRYLRGAGEGDPALWGDLSVWFREFEGTAWSQLDWVSAQVALAFPTSQLQEPVLEVLRDWLETSNNLQKIAIAAQRIAALRPTLCRSTIRARVDRTGDPLVLRLFALGLLSAGENWAAVEEVLKRDERNMLLLRWLRKNQWKSPTVVKDFDTQELAGSP